jgi:hypothetical protein
MNIAEESRRKIKQLESIVTQLQTRIGQIAASYELEIAVLKSNIEMANPTTPINKPSEEEVD